MNSVWTKEPVIKKKIRKNNVWRPTLFLSSFKQNYEFFHGKLKSKKKKEKKVIAPQLVVTKHEYSDFSLFITWF